MKALLFSLLAGSFVMACAPAFPARPELPPMSVAGAEAPAPTTVEHAAPVIPKPDLSSLNAEIRATTGRPARR
ncbi:MAG TPA: hypothetical protein VF037_08290 [Gemmatimonadales bacterium]